MTQLTSIPTLTRMLRCADGDLCASLTQRKKAVTGGLYVNDLHDSTTRLFTHESIEQKPIPAQRSEAFASHEHNSLLILNGHSLFSEPEQIPTQNLNPINRVGVWELRSLIS